MNEPVALDQETAALKVPPHSVEAEQSVLGGLMLDNQSWDNVADRLVADDFHRYEHRLIFNVMASLAEAGRPLDVVTLSEALEGRDQLDTVGGWPTSPSWRATRPRPATSAPTPTSFASAPPCAS